MPTRFNPSTAELEFDNGPSRTIRLGGYAGQVEGAVLGRGTVNAVANNATFVIPIVADRPPVNINVIGSPPVIINDLTLAVIEPVTNITLSNSSNVAISLTVQFPTILTSGTALILGLAEDTIIQLIY